MEGRCWAQPMSHNTCSGLSSGTLGHCCSCSCCSCLKSQSWRGMPSLQSSQCKVERCNRRRAVLHALSTDYSNCVLQWTCWRSRCLAMKRLMQPPRQEWARRRGGAASDVAASAGMKTTSIGTTQNSECIAVFLQRTNQLSTAQLYLSSKWPGTSRMLLGPSQRLHQRCYLKGLAVIGCEGFAKILALMSPSMPSSALACLYQMMYHLHPVTH